MSTNCTRCEGTGFLNLYQIPDVELATMDGSLVEMVQKWIKEQTEPNDVTICDCCGDGSDGWHGTPGEHYTSEDPQGPHGPYAYNGGRCECH